jgi:hypothetical protein
MSSTYTKNKKELASIRLVSADDAWVMDETGKHILNSAFDFVGKIHKSVMPNIIFKANRKDAKNHFVDDFSALPAITKEKVVDFFLNDKTESNNNRRIVYLVRGDKKARNSDGVKKK